MKRFKILIFFFGIHLSLASTSFATEPNWFVPTRDYSQSFVITRSLNGRIAAHDGQIRVTLGDKTQTLTSYDSQDLFEGKLFVTPEDFNFDGYADLNVFQSYGYAGVNIFSRIFLFDPQSLTFVPSIEGSNLETYALKRLVYSSMKSRPYSKGEFHEQDGKIYLAREDAQIEDCVAQRTDRNPQGQIVQEGLYDSCLKEKDFSIKPARVVKIEKAFLHAKPEAAAQTKMYLIRNDAVRLLRTDGTHQWYFVEFHGKKNVTGWLKAADLGLPPGAEGL